MGARDPLGRECNLGSGSTTTGWRILRLHSVTLLFVTGKMKCWNSVEKKKIQGDVQTQSRLTDTELGALPGVRKDTHAMT